MESIDKMSLEDLKKGYLSLYDLIYNVDCYGTSDLRLLNNLEEELDKRGYEVDVIGKAVIRKKTI